MIDDELWSDPNYQAGFLKSEIKHLLEILDNHSEGLDDRDRRVIEHARQTIAR